VDQFWSSVTLIAVADLEKWQGFCNQSSCGIDALGTKKKSLMVKGEKPSRTGR